MSKWFARYLPSSGSSLATRWRKQRALAHGAWQCISQSVSRNDHLLSEDLIHAMVKNLSLCSTTSWALMTMMMRAMSCWQERRCQQKHLCRRGLGKEIISGQQADQSMFSSDQSLLPTVHLGAQNDILAAWHRVGLRLAKYLALGLLTIMEFTCVWAHLPVRALAVYVTWFAAMVLRVGDCWERATRSISAGIQWWACVRQWA